MLVITGAEGRMGRAATAHFQSRSPLLLTAAESNVFEWAGPAQTILHFALDWSYPVSAFDMLRHLLSHAEGLQQVVFASSITVDPHGGLYDMTYYQATKLAGEAWLRAWAAEVPSRLAVSLRLGHFDPGSTPAPEHEALRLTERGLCYWLDRALNQPAGFHIFNALGNGG